MTLHIKTLFKRWKSYLQTSVTCGVNEPIHHLGIDYSTLDYKVNSPVARLDSHNVAPHARLKNPLR